MSDGLLADAMHITEASGLGLDLDLATIPLSRAGADWLTKQREFVESRVQLATGGDDYALVCAIAPEAEMAFAADVAKAGSTATTIGVFTSTHDLSVTLDDQSLNVGSLGWRH